MHETAQQSSLTAQAVCLCRFNGVDIHGAVNFAASEHGIGGGTTEVIADCQPVFTEIPETFSTSESDGKKFERIVGNRFKIARFVEVAAAETGTEVFEFL